MALTALTVEIANLAHPKAREPIEFLLDSGTVYSFVPRVVLSRLGITPHSQQRFQICDGTIAERERGDALYLYNGEAGASPVIFGEPGDATLLGTVTLAVLGLVFDPIRRVLLPLPMIICGVPRRHHELLELRGKIRWKGDVDRLRHGAEPQGEPLRLPCSVGVATLGGLQKHPGGEDAAYPAAGTAARLANSAVKCRSTFGAFTMR